MKKQTALVYVALIIVGIAAGIGFNLWKESQLSPSATTPVRSIVPEIRPAFKLKDIDGKEHDIKEWDGKVLMINFWATWCPPCRKELPAFIEIQDKYASQGFQIIGIALDSTQAVIDFTDPMGINYPLLMAQDEGIPLAQAYGNHLGVLPYTVFVDRKGKIVKTHSRGLDFNQVEAIIKPLL